MRFLCLLALGACAPSEDCFDTGDSGESLGIYYTLEPSELAIFTTEGTTSDMEVITLTNIGDVDATTSSRTNTVDDVFELIPITGDDIEASLNAGEETQFGVRFSPSAGSAGESFGLHMAFRGGTGTLGEEGNRVELVVAGFSAVEN